MINRMPTARDLLVLHRSGRSYGYIADLFFVGSEWVKARVAAAKKAKARVYRRKGRAA